MAAGLSAIRTLSGRWAGDCSVRGSTSSLSPVPTADEDEQGGGLAVAPEWFFPLPPQWLALASCQVRPGRGAGRHSAPGRRVSRLRRGFLGVVGGLEPGCLSSRAVAVTCVCTPGRCGRHCSSKGWWQQKRGAGHHSRPGPPPSSRSPRHPPAKRAFRANDQGLTGSWPRGAGFRLEMAAGRRHTPAFPVCLFEEREPRFVPSLGRWGAAFQFLCQGESVLWGWNSPARHAHTGLCVPGAGVDP